MKVDRGHADIRRERTQGSAGHARARSAGEARCVSDGQLGVAQGWPRYRPSDQNIRREGNPTPSRPRQSAGKFLGNFQVEAATRSQHPAGAKGQTFMRKSKRGAGNWV